jgi:predicted nucleic acid-binding protein
LSLIIDACVAIKWFVPEPGHEAATALLEGNSDLLAPDWLLIEVANALWKQWRRNTTSRIRHPLLVPAMSLRPDPAAWRSP